MKHIKTKKWLSILLAAAILLALSACGAKYAAPRENEQYVTKASDMTNGAASGPDTPSAEPLAPGYSGAGEIQTDLFANLPENVKMIFTANLEMETTEYDRAVQQIAQTVTEME